MSGTIHKNSHLLVLQQQVKRDPQGYKDEFQLQWRHYEANKSLFLMSPSQCSLEFQSLVMFVAHVSEHFPEETKSFVPGIINLLDTHGSLLEQGTRQTLVKALILMRNKSQITSAELLPVLFRLFPVPDKVLKQLMSWHIAADIKGANKKGRNEQFNRKIQNILLPIVEEDEEICAKRALAVLTDMWRRHVWRDARTANAIAAAAFHPSYRVMLGSLKFFLGQDTIQDDDSDDDSDDEGGKSGLAQPTKEEVYKAFHKGTSSSKKKKQKKLKRAMQSVKKSLKREEGNQRETFAAIQLLHDPQEFAEKLFKRMKSGTEKLETRMLMMSVISRVIGVHQLMLINFYPYLQRYIAPSRPDITRVLAALIQSCHEQVPPDVMAPVLRQLVDQFVHDKARPEVITIGIKTVRELCLRAPLIMTIELLQELVEYKKFRDKQVSTAARALLGLFRELDPSMLTKKDRGRNPTGSGIEAYGASHIAHRIQGADLLEAAIRQGNAVKDEDGNYVLVDSDDEGQQDASNASSSEEEDQSVDGAVNDSEEESLEEGEELNEEEEEDNLEEEEEEDNEEEEEEAIEDVLVDSKEDQEDPKALQQKTNKRRRASAPKDSLRALKKKLSSTGAQVADETTETDSTPLEWGRILTQEDFENIKALRQKQLVQDAMRKHGLKSASKLASAREAAEIEAEERLQLEERRSKMHEHAVNPDDLLGKRRGKMDKQERLATVMEGREGREFGAKSSIKKSKTGGLSNKEKQRRKNLPSAAVSGQVKKRLGKKKLKSAKNFKGRVKK